MLVSSTNLDGNSELMRLLAVAHIKLSQALHHYGNDAAALSHIEGGRLICEKINNERDAADRNILRDLGVCYAIKGEVLHFLDRKSEAIDAIKESVNIRKRLANQDPSNIWHQRDLNTVLNKIASLHFGAGDHEQALSSYQQALSIAENLESIDPNNIIFLRDLLVTCYGFAKAAAAANMGDIEMANRKKCNRIIDKMHHNGIIIDGVVKAVSEWLREEEQNPLNQKIIEPMIDQLQMVLSLARHFAKHEGLNIETMSLQEKTALIVRVVEHLGNVNLADVSPEMQRKTMNEAMEAAEHL